MLKCIVAITFVALFSLALPGTSIAEDAKKPPPCDAQCVENKKKADQLKGFEQTLQSLDQRRQQGTGLKPSGTNSRGTVGRNVK
jgi:hypothetical protein